MPFDQGQGVMDACHVHLVAFARKFDREHF